MTTVSSLIPFHLSAEMLSEFSPSALFFLEARIIAADSFQKESFISELGFSIKPFENLDIALFTRTSSVLLIAGVGSYCVYRLSRRLFDRSLKYTILNFTNYNLLARADSRLLHSGSEGFYKVRLGEDDLQQIQTYFNNQNNNENQNKALSITSKCSNCSVAFQRLNHTLTNKIKNEGILAAILSTNNKSQHKLRPQKHMNFEELSNEYCYEELDSLRLFDSLPSTSLEFSKTVLSKNLDTIDNEELGDNILCRSFERFNSLKQKTLSQCSQNEYDNYLIRQDDSSSALSDITSVSRNQINHQLISKKIKNTTKSPKSTIFSKPNTARQFFVDSITLNVVDDINDSASDAASTSLQLAWQDDQLWDDEFAENALQNDFDDSASGISNLSAFKNLQQMLQQREHECNFNLSPRSNFDVTNFSPSRPILNASSLRENNDRQKFGAKPSFLDNTSEMSSVTSIDAHSSVAVSNVGVGRTTILSKCNNDNPNYMYRSAIVERCDIAASDIISVGSSHNINNHCASVASTSSKLSPRFSARLRQQFQVNKGFLDDCINNNYNVNNPELTGLLSLHDNCKISLSPVSRQFEKPKIVALNTFQAASNLTQNFSDAILSRSNVKHHTTSTSNTNSLNNEKANYMTDSCFSKSSYGSSIVSTSSANPAAVKKLSVSQKNNELLAPSSAMFDSAIVMSESVYSFPSIPATHYSTNLVEKINLSGKAFQVVEPAVMKPSQSQRIGDLVDNELDELKFSTNQSKCDDKTKKHKLNCSLSDSSSVVSGITMEWF